MISRRTWLGSALALSAGVFSPLPGCRRGVPAGRRVGALWFSYGGKNRVVLERLVRRFNETQERDYLSAVFQGDYFEGLAKLRTAVAARAAPPLSHVVGEVVPYLAEVGALERLDGLPGAAEIDVVPELGQEKSWIGGGDRPLVTLPFNRSTPIAYLNGRHFAEARLEAPATWDELRETARRLTLRSGRSILRHGFGCPISWWFWVALVGQAGASVADPDGTVTLGGAAGVEALRFWQRLVHEDGTMKPPPGRDYNAWEASNQDFLSGRVSMIWTSTAFLKYLEEHADFPVLAAPLPANVRRAVPTGGTHWIMLRGTPAEAQEVAWAFLRFMHQPGQVIEWATSTGYMPVTRSAVARLEREGYYRAHPNDRVAWDQLAVAMPWPWAADLFRVQREIVEPALEEAVLTRAEAEPLLEAARARARRRR